MTVAMQACPFCNAPVSVSGPSGRRLTCPRCGETFAPRGSDAVQANDGVVVFPPAAASPAPTPEIDRYLGRQSDARGRNRRVAVIVVAIMLAMAGTGLTYALLTQAQRRANDAGLPGQMKNNQPGSDVAELPTGPVRADQSPLLGYVPDGTNVLLGVHIAELRRDPQGRELLRKEISIGSLMSLPLDITPWTGLDGADVDYALLTVTLPRNVLQIGDFKLALLVHSRRPVDEEDVVRRLQASKEIPSGKDAPTWKFHPQGQKRDWSLRFVNPHTLALGLLPGNLTAVPTEPRPGLGHLSDSLRTALPRIEPGGVVWLAANLDQTTRDMLLGLAGGASKESRAPLKAVQTGVAWVRPGTSVTLSAMFSCTDRAAAEKLRAYLAGLDPNLHDPDLKMAVDDSAWLSVQRRADLATVLQIIDKGIKH